MLQRQEYKHDILEQVETLLNPLDSESPSLCKTSSLESKPAAVLAQHCRHHL